MSENIEITADVAEKATNAAVDALVDAFIPALLNVGVTKDQIVAAMREVRGANDNA
jgi:hypothetical protein